MSLRSRASALLPEFFVLAIAALLRFWRLGYHSIWFDEAVSLRWATDAELLYMWRTTFRLVEEKHPPVYYTLLRIWHELLTPLGLGHSDAALRALGAALGVLTVLGVLLLARRLGGRISALLAALLVAVSPVLVWYSQELRMFQPATTGLVWASYFLLAAWQTEPRIARLWRWAAFALCLELALYTYLFSAFMLPAAGLTLLVLLFEPQRLEPQRLEPQTSADGRRWKLPWGRFWEGAVALAITSALYLPLARNAWSVNGATSTPTHPFANFPETTRKVFKIFTLWKEDWPALLTESALVGLGILVVLGVALPWGEKMRPRLPEGVSQRAERLWLLVWIGAPWLVANLLLSRSTSIFREDRYLIFVAPFVLWAMARGAVALGTRWRWAGWLTGGAAVLLLVACLPRLWTPTMYRENWRAATRYIEQYAEQSPGLRTAVVAHISYTHQPLDWYLRQRYTMDELPVWGLFGDPITPEDLDTVVAPPLLGIVEWGADTLWLTQSHLEGVDDARRVEGWLEERYPLITEQYPDGVKLTGYALQSEFESLPALAPHAVRADSALAPDLTLVACEVTTPTLRATDQELHPPSGWVHVRLWWRVAADTLHDYTITARVVNAEGVWGERVDRGERSALRRFGTSTWSSDTLHRDEHDIGLNPVTPPGEYRVVIGLRNETGAELETRADCGSVQIVP